MNFGDLGIKSANFEQAIAKAGETKGSKVVYNVHEQKFEALKPTDVKTNRMVEFPLATLKELAKAVNAQNVYTLEHNLSKLENKKGFSFSALIKSLIGGHKDDKEAKENVAQMKSKLKDSIIAAKSQLKTDEAKRAQQTRVQPQFKVAASNPPTTQVTPRVQRILDMIKNGDSPGKIAGALQAKGERGRTPLHEACESGDSELIGKLLDGAKSGTALPLLGSLYHQPDNEGVTPQALANRTQRKGISVGREIDAEFTKRKIPYKPWI